MRTSAMIRPLNLAALLCFAGYTLAHEHHMDDIPEGEGISADPIVRHYHPTVPTTFLTKDRIPYYGFT